MTPPDPPGEPPSGAGEPSGGVPRATEPTTTGGVSAAVTSRTRTQALFENPVWRFVKRWGFPLFVLLVVIWGRSVLLPFVFAALIAYILAPVVQWLSVRKDGHKRMPRSLAIVLCYLAFLGCVVGFLFLLVPRLSQDVARIGSGISIKRINEEWTPEVARWLEDKFPSLANVTPTPDRVQDMLPERTAFTMTPLPDGRIAVQIAPNGVDLTPLPDGSFHVHINDAPPESPTLEAKLRSLVKKAMESLQSNLDDVVQFGQSLLTGFIRGIFLFFFTLMIGAFILVDLEKVHGFLRNLFPQNVRDDYDVIKAGIDRGLSGVIRGQLLICLVNGILTYIGLLIFDVKYSLILAVVAGMMSMIPIFGSILSSVPIVAVALVSSDSGIDFLRGVAMTAWIIGIHFLEANLLNPKIIGTAAKIHPVLVVFSLFLGEHSYGLVGALFAVPILSAIQVVFMFLYKKTWKDTPGRTA